MKYIHSDEKAYDEVLAFFDLLDLEKSKKCGLPVFKNNDRRVIPINFSTNSFNETLYSFLTEVLKANGEDKLYYLPILPPSMEIVDRLESFETHFSKETGEKHFHRMLDCGILEVDQEDPMTLVVKSLNQNEHCFTFSSSYLITSVTKNWCIIDFYDYPTSLFYCKARQLASFKKVVGSISGLSISKDEFEEGMIESRLKTQFDIITRLT